MTESIQKYYPRLNEVEQQFILRLPEQYAIELHELMKRNLAETLTITWTDNQFRTADITFKDKKLYGKLMDLPCIVESQKTLNKSSFYKTADICQILVASETPFEDGSKQGSCNKKNPFAFPDGLTPPLKNARKRRFRKTAAKKLLEREDVEQEVNLLLKEDDLAIDVKTEWASDEEDTEDKIEVEEMDDDGDLAKPRTIVTNFPHDDQQSTNENKDINVLESKDNQFNVSQKIYFPEENISTDFSNSSVINTNKKDQMNNGSDSDLGLENESEEEKERVEPVPEQFELESELGQNLVEDTSAPVGLYTTESQINYETLPEFIELIKSLDSLENELRDLQIKINERLEQISKTANPILQVDCYLLLAV
ncbi:transcription initiation factor TFIID subunit 7-like [Zophobas morio]|uniref:transcription initiation factor TFIID subunit 7-like n=1 Tax=Zophobas morio TaxID=2755281 RepID=UPI003082DE19